MLVPEYLQIPRSNNGQQQHQIAVVAAERNEEVNVADVMDDLDAVDVIVGEQRISVVVAKDDGNLALERICIDDFDAQAAEVRPLLFATKSATSENGGAIDYHLYDGNQQQVGEPIAGPSGLVSKQHNNADHKEA